MGMVFMPTRPIPKVIPPFDWLGFALLCTALLGLMTGIADGQRERRPCKPLCRIQAPGGTMSDVVRCNPVRRRSMVGVSEGGV